MIAALVVRVVTAAIAALAIAWLLSSRAAAQSPETVLVRVWVAEVRWTSERAQAGMAHVLERWATGKRTELAAAADALVWAHSNPPSWIRQLEPGCAQPRGWPRRWRWSRHEGLCLALYERAGAFLAGAVADPCRGKADGWRSPGKATRRALRRGYRRVWCGRVPVVFVVYAGRRR